MILLVDNYDSFSYNLFQLIGSIRQDIRVIRNDELTVDEISKLSPDAIILSPGPGRPEDAGYMPEIIREFYDKIPIFGVCLGHQAICQVFGADIVHARKLMHGKQSQIEFDKNEVLFNHCPDDMKVARYHSLAADFKEENPHLKILARTLDGEVMAIRHRQYPVYGVQFHPESILTSHGEQLMRNFFEEVTDHD